MVHTRFFANESDAVAAYEDMKPALVEILSRLPGDDEDLEATVAVVDIINCDLPPALDLAQSRIGRSRPSTSGIRVHGGK